MPHVTPAVQTLTTAVTPRILRAQAWASWKVGESRGLPVRSRGYETGPYASGVVFQTGGAVQPVVTWYDILDVMPGASTEEIQGKYEAKASLLRPELIAGAPSAVITAVSRAQQLLDTARGVLGDPATRARYDAAAGIRRSGGGLAQQESFPSEPGWGPEDLDVVVGTKEAELLGGLMALTDWLAPHPGPPRRIIVPDVQGLFYSVCLQIAGRLGLRIRSIQLTEHPMPVEGLVVGQSPRPAVKVRRASDLTVQVWHPPH